MVKTKIPFPGIGRVAANAATRTMSGSTQVLRGISRNGIIAAERIGAQPIARRSAHRVTVLAVGAILIGLGVGLFAHAQLGLPPYDVLVSVLRDRIGISLGQAGWLLAGALLVIAMSLRQFPTFATAAYIFANGITVDAAIGLLNDPEPLAVRIIFVVMGIAALGGGIALVVHSGLGGGVFELLMRAGQVRGVDPMRVRTFLEVGLLGAGIAMGGDFGPATVVFALTIGPMLRLGAQVLADHRAGRAHRLGRADATPPPTSHQANRQPAATTIRRVA